MQRKALLAAWGALLFATAGCAEDAKVPIAETIGAAPTLPAPTKSALPTIRIPSAVGLRTGLDHPRWLYVLPNGGVLVAETNGPERPDDAKGFKGWVMGLAMKRAGAAVPS